MIFFRIIHLSYSHLTNKGDDYMPSKSENERTINDPTASATPKMGIHHDSNSGVNLTNYIPKQDPEMKQFEKLMRGNKLDD